MTEKQAMTEFEGTQLGQMMSYVSLDQNIKKLTELQKSIKEELLEQMGAYGIKTINNDILKITRVQASESTSVDLKSFAKKEPTVYAGLLEDYPKVTKRKESIRITVKKVSEWAFGILNRF